MSRWKRIAVWVLQILLALLFVQSGVMKLGHNPGMVELFEKWGYPDKFYLVIGALELLGALGLLIPPLAGYAAAGLMVIMLGALATHLRHGEMQAVVPVVLLAVLAIVAYARRPGFLRARQKQSA